MLLYVEGEGLRGNSSISFWRRILGTDLGQGFLVGAGGGGAGIHV